MSKLRVSPRILALLCAVAVVPVVVGATAETASAHSCDQLRELIERAVREEAQAHVDTRAIRSSIELDLARLMWIRYIQASRGVTDPVLANEEILVRRNQDQLLDNHAQSTVRRVAIEDRRIELQRQYREQGCDDEPPDDPMCVPADSSPRLRSERAWMRLVRRSDPENRILGSLVSPTGASVLARIREDGTVVDARTGDFVTNPANPAWTLQVPFGPGSPFRAGQQVTIVYTTIGFSGPGVPTQAVMFLNEFGTQITPPRPSTEPEGGLFDRLSGWWIPTRTTSSNSLIPVGAAVAGTAAAALLTVMAEANATALQVIGLMLQQQRAGRPDDSASAGGRVRPGCGFRAVFQLRNGVSVSSEPPAGSAPAPTGKWVGVGTSCTGIDGPWTWKFFQGDGNRGFSASFGSSLSNRRWSGAGRVAVWVHAFSLAQWGAMSSIKQRQWMDVIPGFVSDHSTSVGGWEFKLKDSDGLGRGRLGKIVMAGAGRGVSGRVVPTNAALVKRGCSAQPPAGYQEQQVP